MGIPVVMKSIGIFDNWQFVISNYFAEVFLAFYLHIWYSKEMFLIQICDHIV